MKKSSISLHHGQTLVEFAIILPVLLLLSIIILDLGRAVYYSSAIHNAAREGVRYGAVHNEASTNWVGMRQAAREKAVGVPLTNANITSFGWGPDEPNGNHTVQMTIVYSFTPATPLAATFLPGGIITLIGDAKMRTEYDNPNP